MPGKMQAWSHYLKSAKLQTKIISTFVIYSLWKIHFFDTINHDIRKLNIIVFSDSTVKWFKFYLSNWEFLFRNFWQLHGVPQGSLFGLLLFLVLVDILMAVKYNLYLYVNGTCLVFQSKNVKDVEKQLNEDFANTCDKFVDNKLHSHLGEDNTKSILFVSSVRSEKLPTLTLFTTMLE